MKIPSTTGKIFLCAAFFIAVTETAFGQVSDLSLDASDIRFEPVYSNYTVIGYNLFVRKKTEMESVMLTEPSGYHALRSTEWNSINGSERRELSGVPLSGAYSQYSILSSTPIHDTHFGSAFHLFIPFRFVYGNPSSFAGTVFLQISNGVQINIRTFDHKYADPNTGIYQNNQFIIVDVSDPRDLQYPPPPAPSPESPVIPGHVFSPPALYPETLRPEFLPPVNSLSPPPALYSETLRPEFLPPVNSLSPPPAPYTEPPVSSGPVQQSETRDRDDDIEDLKTALRRIGISDTYLSIFINDTDLQIFLIKTFEKRYREQN